MPRQAAHTPLPHPDLILENRAAATGENGLTGGRENPSSLAGGHAPGTSVPVNASSTYT